MRVPSPQDKTGEILIHVEWIRETLEELKQEAREDREVLAGHLLDDRREFGLVWGRLNWLLGGVSLLGAIGAGSAAAEFLFG